MFAVIPPDNQYRYDGFGRRYNKERTGTVGDPQDEWKATSLWYVGLSYSVLSETTEIERWNGKSMQSGLDYLVGPGGRAYGAQESYIKNGHEWSPNTWKNTRYYHYDRLGSVVSVTLDKPGLDQQDYQYGPFGQVLDGEHKWGWEYNGEESLGFEEIGFTGYRYDSESGLYHAPFREYDPMTASWTTSDPIKDGMLWYGFVESNPLKYVDPLGLEHDCNLDPKYENLLQAYKNIYNQTLANQPPGNIINAYLEHVADATFYLDLNFKYPVDKKKTRRTTNFGFNVIEYLGKTFLRYHGGIDEAASIPIPIYAAHSGYISVNRNDKDIFGLNITILYAKKFPYDKDVPFFKIETQYSHLISLFENIEDDVFVNKGDIIGYMGNTGMSKGIHLDFRVLFGGFLVDPELFY